MSLYIKVQTKFYTHRKTMRLRLSIGNDALWVVPRIWAYTAEHHPDGSLSGYSAEELAMLIGYNNDPLRMLEGLLKAGFLDDDMQVHGWDEHNGYHTAFSERAKAANSARWEKHRAKKEKDRDRDSDKDKDKETRSPQGVLVVSLKDVPTMDEVLAECATKGASNGTADEFWNYYESNGWKVGKNKMASWRAALAGWISRNSHKALTATAKPHRAEKSKREWNEVIEGKILE